MRFAEAELTKFRIKTGSIFTIGAGIALILFPGITSLILGKAEFQGEMIENN